MTRAIDTWGEVHRHRCEVRWCLREGLAWFEVYVKGVKKERGAVAARALWRDVKAQAAQGNDGGAARWV